MDIEALASKDCTQNTLDNLQQFIKTTGFDLKFHEPSLRLVLTALFDKSSELQLEDRLVFLKACSKMAIDYSALLSEIIGGSRDESEMGLAKPWFDLIRKVDEAISNLQIESLSSVVPPRVPAHIREVALEKKSEQAGSVEQILAKTVSQLSDKLSSQYRDYADNRGATVAFQTRIAEIYFQGITRLEDARLTAFPPYTTLNLESLDAKLIQIRQSLEEAKKDVPRTIAEDVFSAEKIQAELQEIKKRVLEKVLTLLKPLPLIEPAERVRVKALWDAYQELPGANSDLILHKKFLGQL